MTCRHCRDPKRIVNRPRGLCWRCYYTPGVRERYGADGKWRPDLIARGCQEPTEVELNRLIAERLPTMPERERG